MQNVSVSLVVMVVFTILAYMRQTNLVYNSKISGVKPNIASWLPWLVVDASIFFASIALGEVKASIIFGIFTIGTLVTLSLIVRNGEIKLSKMDKISLTLSLIAIVMWKMTSQPEVALYLNIFIAVMASIPTLRQALIDPKLEDGRVWFYFSVGGGANLLTIEEWTMTAALPAVLVFLIQLALFWAASREEKWFKMLFRA